MRLFLLRRLSEINKLDVMDGIVVRAYSEWDARVIAEAHRGDEVRRTWLDPLLSSCVLLTNTGEYGAIIRDFNAG